MLSTRSIFQEIRNNTEALRLLLSIAAKGETQGGWENRRIAELTEDPDLKRKVLRHGDDETKHGLLFSKVLRRNGLEAAPVPLESDYCMLLEINGIGLSHARLHQDTPLTHDEFLKYLVHSKVTEERAAEDVQRLLNVFADDPQLGPSLKVIANDEVNHLSYAHEELLKLCAQGEEEKIMRMLKDYAMVEIRVYYQVGNAFVRAMARFLGWSKQKQWLLQIGVLGTYAIERWFTWRRLVNLHPPVRVNAMG